MTRIKIISGAQTGVDRAALDAAIACGLDYGGSIPRGRRAEDGPLAKSYTALKELQSDDYAVRTRRNVLDAEATIILCPGAPDGGTALTERIARELGRPVMVVDIDRHTKNSAMNLLHAWLNTLSPSVLNIAGPRESKSPGVYTRAYDILQKLFQQLYG